MLFAEHYSFEAVMLTALVVIIVYSLRMLASRSPRPRTLESRAFLKLFRKTAFVIVHGCSVEKSNRHGNWLYRRVKFSH